LRRWAHSVGSIASQVDADQHRDLGMRFGVSGEYP
jgi:hypothetical protein